ncbi:hypothetical protein BGZ60DRAFT_53530 [Tricladium varicosporioides]|nr:hypothetical protein BGZ60DRAFT_53530 [Hymenoscyphus varicosporioides]
MLFLYRLFCSIGLLVSASAFVVPRSCAADNKACLSVERMVQDLDKAMFDNAIGAASGILTCGKPQDYFREQLGGGLWKLEDLESRVKSFCHGFATATKGKESRMGPKKGDGVYNHFILNTGPLSISISHNGAEGCPSPSYSGAAGEKLCNERFHTVIDNCQTSKNDKEFWKIGGYFFQDCVTWEVGTYKYIRSTSGTYRMLGLRGLS